MTSPQLGIGRLWDWATLKKQHVYFFNEGSAEEKDLLGNKGANLCEMFRLGLPVPQGFVISTDACKEFYKQEDLTQLDEHLWTEIERSVHELERQTGKPFSKQELQGTLESSAYVMPLLLSVRSGAAVSMPGMMDTILNLGVNDTSIHIMARASGNVRWAYDTYRRFLQMFGSVALGIDAERYEKILAELRAKRGVTHDSQLAEADLIHAVNLFKAFTPVPDDPWEQLRIAIRAVFFSWNSPRAIKYRDIHGIPQDLGTAVTVQSMVFGNMNDKSGSGVAFTRNPATGEKELYGEFLSNAEGEDVVAGIRTPMKIIDLANDQPSVYETLVHIEKLLERHYRNMQDIEFTIENGILYILQTRNGKRTAQAAVKIAIDMVKEKLITEREALMRLDAKQMDYFLHPMIDPAFLDSKKVLLTQFHIGTGLAASAGAAIGHIVFTNEDAVQFAAEGKKCILCRPQTSADDIAGLKAAEGVLTTRGGLTSHAAVVMRGMGKSAVTGVRDLVVDVHAQRLTSLDGKVSLGKGDVVTIDGSTGAVFRGEIPTVSSGQSADFQTVLHWADKYKNMLVFANADTPEEAKKALQLGAEGIGLCRTEHMFFSPERLSVFRHLLLTDSAKDRAQCLEKLQEMQQADFEEMFKVMQGRQVTVRLLDPPVHEFLPDASSEDFEREAQQISQRTGIPVEQCKRRIGELQEKNPMMGCRGCRLGIIHPEIVAMQTKAIVGGAIHAKKQGSDCFVQIMIPLVFTDHEVDMIANVMEQSFMDACSFHGMDPNELNVLLGTMIEVPRACIRADRIASAKHMSFISFGTNDLTQYVFGMSRDDTQQFMSSYVQNHLLAKDPFLSLDTHGVGPLMHLAIKRARNANPSIRIGACGEHAGDPASIQYMYHEGVDYLSCSPFRVPTAKVAAAQARIEYIARAEEEALLLYPPMF